MRKIVVSIISVLCAVVFALGLTSCGLYSYTVLANPIKSEPLTWAEQQSESFNLIAQSANTFAAELSPAAYQSTEKPNFVISPVSVYMALAVATESTAGQTRQELLSALGVSYEQLIESFSLLYRSLELTHAHSGKVMGMLDLTNSIWIDKNVSVNTPTLNSLANNFYCYARSTDFLGDNEAANRAIEKFIKDKTNDLIDVDLSLAPETVFAIINTIYLKDKWSAYVEELNFTDEAYCFNSEKGEDKELNFLQGYYTDGQAYEADTFTHFYTKTTSGYKLKFILPKDGYTVADVFTAQNISAVNSLDDYLAIDEENGIAYYTRCLFPEFSVSYDEDLKNILCSTFDINSLFDNASCDFSSLTSQDAYCSGVQHLAELKVTKKGIEGAAVTIMPAEGDLGQDYEEVYYDFTVDRSFGFILTDSNDTVIFTGVIDNV